MNVLSLIGGSKKSAFGALAAVVVGLILPGWGADKTWVGGTSSLASEDANWQGGAKPATGDSVIMSGAVDMTWDLDDVTLVNWTQNGYTGTVTFETGETGLSAKGVAQSVHGVLVDGERLLKLTGNLNLQSGTWTCKDNPEFNTSNSAKDPAMTSGRGVYRLIVDVAGTAEIGSGATVSVVGKGFQYTQGRWGTAIGGGCGGSHGGCSYSSYDNAIGGSGHAPQHCYGSIRAPITIGSCGGDNVNMQTLPGGAIRLKVSGALTLNGTLNANSSNVPKNGGTAYRAPGSGGSVWVTASSITGTGAITANGMKHTSFGCSGGGRISVCLTGSGSDFSSFSPSQMTAYGGRKDGTSTEVTASAGTIYLETPANKADGGELRVCGDVTNKELAMATRFGTEIWTGLDDESFAFAKIYLANNVSLRISDGIVLSAKAMDGLNPSANQMRLYNGNFQQTGSTPFENVRIAVGVSNTVVSSSLRLGTGAQFLPNYPTTVNGNVTLANGAKIMHWLNGAADKDYRVNLKVTGDMSIDADSSVDVEGMGFNSAVGEGKPGISNCASGHGGMPGNPSATGVCYGNFKEPTALGSGSSHIAGSGAINLEVAGTLTVNGKISAKGMDQVLYPSAGGSVWLKAGQLSGTGTITAIGGNSNNNHTYSAGGGRIAIAVTNANAKVSAFTGTIVAHGGTKTSGKSVVGGAGTIYLRDAGQDLDSGTLIIDNGKCTTSDNKTVITSAMTDETVGAVVITNNAQLFIENNRTLTVKGDWDSRGSSVATIGAAASISGGFSAKWLYCEQHDQPRTYRFEPGKTVTVTGELRLKGADGANARLSLMSMQSGTRWDIASRGVAIVAGVSVRDSNAATGNKIYACAPSSGQDCDANWVFNVPTSTWTGGGGNNLFTNDANWAEGAAPTVDSIVYVNTPAEISVGSEADARALTLVVEAGGRAKLTGTARLALADSLQVMGGGTLTADVQVVVNNDAVLFSGATLTCSPNGVWDGVTDPAALTYKRLQIEVGGSMIVESGAAIDVSGKGFAAGDTTYLSGPGYGYGGGYAGWGFRTYPPKASYGSVFAPMSLGSGGDEDVAGGAVRLAIGGTLTLNGSIKANGRDAVSTLQSYKGSGGSVYVTCAALTGSGTIEARGGNVMNDYCGSGGRISVVQSTASGFSAWTGTITAYGGRRIGDAQLPLAPCGTVYLRSAGEVGTVYFDNDNGAHGDATKDHLGKGYGYTDIISTNLTSDVKADFKVVTLVARRGTTLNLLTDLRVKDLQMLTANTELKLNGHTLSVGVRRHALAGTVIEDGGRIDWWRPGMMVILH